MAINISIKEQAGRLLVTVEGDLNNAATKQAVQSFAPIYEHTDCDVAIQGHTDNVGFKGKTAAQSVEMNKALSLDRAASVSTYLQSLGVSAAQIKAVDGLGQDSPIASNDTEAGRQQNRRVEIYMYASQDMINAAEAGTLQ